MGAMKNLLIEIENAIKAYLGTLTKEQYQEKYGELAQYWREYRMLGPRNDEIGASLATIALNFSEWIDTDEDEPRYGLSDIIPFFAEKERQEGTAIPEEYLDTWPLKVAFITNYLTTFNLRATEEQIKIVWTQTVEPDNTPQTPLEGTGSMLAAWTDLQSVPSYIERFKDGREVF